MKFSDATLFAILATGVLALPAVHSRQASSLEGVPNKDLQGKASLSDKIALLFDTYNQFKTYTNAKGTADLNATVPAHEKAAQLFDTYNKFSDYTKPKDGDDRSNAELDGYDTQGGPQDQE